MAYLGSLGSFSTLGSMFARWLPLRKAAANGGSGMCSMLSLVLYHKHVHSTSQTLLADY
jgi:hypothetical protein